METLAGVPPRQLNDHCGSRAIDEDGGSHLQISEGAETEKKAREVFEDEHEQKRRDLRSRLEKEARRMDHDRIRQNKEERIAGVEALEKELKAEAAAASRDQRETYDQYHRLCREWRTEETKSGREFRATFHQGWVRQPLKVPDLPTSVLPFKEDSKLAEPQRSAVPPPTNAEASRTEVSAWVGSTSERRPTHEARRTPQSQGLRAKFTDYSKTLGRWKFLSLRELETEQMDPPTQRAIAELGRVLDNDLSWRSNFPGLVDIKTAMLRELWGHMRSFSRELHQAVWDVLQKLARATPGKIQEGRSDWKRYHDRSPPKKFRREVRSLPTS